MGSGRPFAGNLCFKFLHDGPHHRICYVAEYAIKVIEIFEAQIPRNSRMVRRSVLMVKSVTETSRPTFIASALTSLLESPLFCVLLYDVI